MDASSEPNSPSDSHAIIASCISPYSALSRGVGPNYINPLSAPPDSGASPAEVVRISSLLDASRPSNACATSPAPIPGQSGHSAAEGTTRHAQHLLESFSRPADPPVARCARRGAIDAAACGLPTDYWHCGRAQRYVRPNKGVLPCIPFISLDVRTPGVALTELVHGVLALNAGVPALSWLPPAFQCIESARFVIRWPGYEHLEWGCRMEFMRPITRQPVTLLELGVFIAGQFKRFYDKFRDEYNNNGLRLGPQGVTFNEVRLQEVYTADGGETWEAEMSFIMAD